MKKYLGSLDYPMAQELINPLKNASPLLTRYLHCISLPGMIIK